jgi:SRSO17 transposase
VDLQEFAEIEESFRRFHAHFAPAFRRQQWRERSQDYLRGLLVQAQERGNAENLAEAVEDASPRVLQRFLTEAKWDDQAVTEALQQYLAPRLADPEAVWIVDGSDFPKQGKKSVGVTRQYCGALGKVANCQAGVFLAYSSPRGRALVDKRLFLPEEWTNDPARCTQAGVPEPAQTYQKKTDLALSMLAQAQQWGFLEAGWVTGDDHFGQSPEFRDGLAAAQRRSVLEVPGHLTVWPVDLSWETPPYGGFGRPPKPRLAADQRQEIQARRAALLPEAWEEMTVGEGAQGPRTYRFAFERVRVSRDQKPGEEVWLIYKENLDGTEPRAFFSNAPVETPRTVLARVAMSRWPVETEFEDEKSLVALDEYEVRSWAGLHHHVTMGLLASAFLLTLQQDWKKKDAPDHSPTGVPGGLRTAAAQALDPRRVVGLADPDASPQRGGKTQSRETAAPAALRRVQPQRPLSLISSL